MKIIRQLEFKVFTIDASGKEQVDKWIYRAGAGKFYSRAKIESIKEEFMDSLAMQFPDVTFHLVPIGPNKFNVLHTVGNA